MGFDKNNWMKDGDNQCNISQDEWPVFVLVCPLYDVAGETCDDSVYIDLAIVNSAFPAAAVACAGGLY
jgi:hypothetical protein